MSLPHFDFPESPHISGNAKDDDAEILDNLVESKAQPPTPEEMPLVRHEGVSPPKRISRLITNTINIDKSWTVPTQILPADPNRTQLRINVNSTTAADVVNLADEQNKAQNAGTSFVASPATRGWDLIDYTGALWAFAPLAAGTVTVTVAAVSS